MAKGHRSQIKRERNAQKDLRPSAKLSYARVSTADCALEQGKDVYAVPGRITDSMSIGCNTLIKNGAALYDNIYEILDMFSIERDDNGKPECEKNNFLATDEKIVYANLCFEPKHISRIAAETQKPVEDIMRTVLHLETRHIIRQTANNYYVKL